MLSKLDIYNKIKDVYPDIGEFDKDVVIDYDTVKHVWVVDLKDERKHLKTYLEEEDAESCVGKNKCFGIGIQIGELRYNLKEM
jgi:hypothetical protein